MDTVRNKVPGFVPAGVQDAYSHPRKSQMSLI